MLKIRALNRESSSDEDGPAIRKEAQEEIALDMYNNALRMQCSNNLSEALDILKKLLDENIPQLESQGGLPKTMSTIKYSCYINIASIYMQQGETKNALEHYLTASELDKTDVTLWYKIGMLAIKQDRFRQAVHAFANGLQYSESHWPCLDQLISVLFGIKDTIACLEYIDKALILDPYYIKGLVLRKSIYESNPATEEYYKQFNPKHCLVPKVDVDISEEDEKYFLDEIQKLCDRINEVEKSFAPKPLPVIPLPIPLEDFTWVDLGKTLTGLHKYISDNNMSYLSKINLKKCMSRKGEESPVVEEKPMEVDPEKIEDVILIEDNSPETAIENVPTENAEKLPEERDIGEKMDSADVMERRMSSTSDNDATTPVQTDENEEMEQDTEDQEDNPQKSDKSRLLNRSSKRKRDLLSELQIWGWHSKRKSTKKGRSDRDYTIEDALTRIIPSHLLPNGINGDKYNPMEDSMCTMDLYNMHMQENKAMEQMISPIGSPVPEDKSKYFGSDEEKADVKSFWTRDWENCDVIDLIEEYVYAIAELWKLKWPTSLVPLYIEAYNMFRQHCSHPPLFNTEIAFERFRKDALTSILYGELTTYTNKKIDVEDEIHCTSVSHLTLLSAWDVNWALEHTSFAIRVHWLRAHLFKKKSDNVLAISALQLVEEFLNGEEGSERISKLFLPNCLKYGVITLSIIKRMLSNLEMVHSLSQIEDLYNSQRYREVAEILKTTFSTSSTNNSLTGKIGRAAQLGMLMHSLWFTDMTDCFVWTEECLNETLGHYLKPTTHEDKWEMVLDKCLGILHEIIKNETVSVLDALSDMKRNRLVECLSILCARQINADSSTKIPFGNVVPWILLHYILLRDEHRQQAKKVVQHINKDKNSDKPVEQKKSEEEDEIPSSIAILFSAHDFLGPKGWCLVNQGELLHFILDTIIYRLDTPIFESIREKIDIHLEQAFFCLYQHPCKKNKVSRHLADHNVNPLPLVWSRAQQLYEFFCPDALPEFDSYKSISISSELEQLLQRITAIVPKECDPQPLLPKISAYIHSNSNEMPDLIDFPLKIRGMYYLLGDYFFKQSEVTKSYKYFLLDLCINPTRIDTWAGLALGIHSQLELKLNHCERFKTEMEFIEKAKSAKICFREALKLNDAHVTLWIEFGSFEYMVHSFCSRVLKYESDTLSMEKFEILESEKESYLNGSNKSFQQALGLYRVDQGEADERWLYHYMLAKISEKQQEDPNVYLQHYLTAASLLHENKCTYPDKINYSNPQHLSLEALEVHYRINASILKYLELHDGKIIPAAIGKLFKKCLDSSMIQKSKYEVGKNEKTTSPTGEENSDDKIRDDVKICLEEILKQIDDNDKLLDDDVVIIESDDEKPQEEAKEEPRIKVKNVEDIMEELMRETMKQSDPPTNDSDLDNTLANEEKEEKVENSPENKMDVDDVKSESKSVKSEDESNIRKSTTTATEDSSSSSSSSESSSSSDSESEDSSSTSSSSSENSNENLSEAEIISLVDRCIIGLEHCIRRLPQNYKALYRLAHIYFSYSKKKDLSKCKQLLLSEYKCKNSVLVTGLFSDRKTSNFFNGIWRIPSSEIDRPGSLSAHMGRCVNLLLQVLRDTQDHKTLFDLCLQLRRIPDTDKIYIRHSEREQLSEQALTMCIQSLRTQIKTIQTATPVVADKLLVDIFRAYQRCQKNLTHQEKVFSGMLIEAYKKFMGDKIGENANVFDMALKYCQQSRMTEKLKKQQTQPTPKMPMPSATPPVLPSPTSLTSLNQPIKRQSIRRPRGRPPGPSKSPRGRSPMSSSNNFSWQNSMFNSSVGMDYVKQYQDELLRQYSQTLTMSQLNSMGQNMFNTSALLNAAAASSNMLNPTSLVQQMQQINSGMNTLAANQLSQSLSQLNPSLLKKISNQLTGSPGMLTPEKLLQLTALAQQAGVSKPNKTSSPQQNKPAKAKSVYATSGSTKTATSTAAGSATGFKYPTVDILKTKPNKPTTFTNQKDVPKAHSQKSQLSIEKTTNLIKDRPSISITPVNQTTISPVKPQVTASPGKTLQEKLADKQKQQKSAVAKTLDFNARNNDQQMSYSGYSQYNKPGSSSRMPPIPKSLDVIPNYLMDSGISISQVQQKQKAVEITPIRKDQSKTKSSGMPISMSVVRKPEEKAPPLADDDDVIIIE